jgi:hypothetical protein
LFVHLLADLSYQFVSIIGFGFKSASGGLLRGHGSGFLRLGVGTYGRGLRKLGLRDVEERGFAL